MFCFFRREFSRSIFIQAVEEVRRKCDQLHAHLLEIELAYAHQPQIKALNAEQIPAEIEQAKVDRLLSMIIILVLLIESSSNINVMESIDR